MMLDHLCRLEDLDRDLKVVRDATKKSISVPNLNRGRRQVQYHDLYLAEARQIVNSLFRPDFESLGYEMIE
jgi:hypothetical protein